MNILLSLLIFSLMALALTKPMEDMNNGEMTDKSALKETVETNLSSNSNDDDDDDDGDDDEDITGVFTGTVPLLPAVPMSPMFGGALFQKLQESIQDLQNQLYYMWNQSMNATNLMDMPDNYKNSSSHTQVINGTVMTVNETVYKVVNNGIQSVYHIKEISFRPENDTDVTGQPQLSQQKLTQDTTTNPPPTSATTTTATAASADADTTVMTTTVSPA